MKPPPFAYLRPDSVEEACDLLAEHADDAKILAGGQSLVPAMNLRLARPGVLIDINRLSDLDFVQTQGPLLRIGALTRHEELRRGIGEHPLDELVRNIAGHIGHWAIRERGTFGGSLAHADPAGEWGLLSHTLPGQVVARSVGGVRTIEAENFFDAPFITALRADELLIEAHLRPPSGTAVFGFAEFSRRPGDFALAMVMVALGVDDGTIQEARIGIGGVQGRPIRSGPAEEVAVGREATPALIEEVASACSVGLTAMDDQHASSHFRLSLAGALLKDAMTEALSPWIRFNHADSSPRE